MITKIEKLFYQAPKVEGMTEVDRKALARELIDTYNGNGDEYLKIKIDEQSSSPLLTAQMNLNRVSYGYLKKIINKVSKVYKEQPKRRFFQNGKEILSGDPLFKGADVIIDDTVLSIIKNELYSLEITTALKEAERKTNLLNTAIYKINYYDKKLNLDYISNDSCSIVPEENNQKIAKEIAYSLSEGSIDVWTRSEQVIVKGNKQTRLQNESGKKQLELGYNNIGTAFAPFVVLRASLPDQEFWDIKNKDAISTIKQINLAFTELRYLVRYSSFGLKYAINLEVPDGASADPLGMWVMQSESTHVGDSKNFEIGELPNKGDLQGVKETILFLVSQLLYTYSLSSQDLVSSGQKSTAESKEYDVTDFKEYLKEQQLIWKLNEKNLFEVMRLVWNRENEYKIPYDIVLMVDYPEVEEVDTEQEALKWVVEIENNVKTAIDWIMQENKDLTREQAIDTLKNNVKINEELNIEEQEDYSNQG
jgi:hypothetical protein